jgi:hypothetical protein
MTSLSGGFGVPETNTQPPESPKEKSDLPWLYIVSVMQPDGNFIRFRPVACGLDKKEVADYYELWKVENNFTGRPRLETVPFVGNLDE